MRILGEEVICSKCGSDDMRVVAGVLAECGNCGLGMLVREFDQWKDGYKKLPNREEMVLKKKVKMTKPIIRYEGIFRVPLLKYEGIFRVPVPYCGDCGKRLMGYYDDFCVYCGASTDRIKCSCGRGRKSNIEKFCPKCGGAYGVCADDHNAYENAQGE